MKVLFEARKKDGSWTEVEPLKWVSLMLSGVKIRARFKDLPVLSEEIFKMKNKEYWPDYNKRVVRGEPVVDLKYTGDYDASLLQEGREEKVKLRCGKVAIFKLLKWQTRLGDHHMSTWQMVKFEDGKPLTEMNFREFVATMKTRQL